MSSLCFAQRIFDWGEEVALAGEEGGGIGGKLPPSMLKKPWFQNKHWGTGFDPYF